MRVFKMRVASADLQTSDSLLTLNLLVVAL